MTPGREHPPAPAEDLETVERELREAEPISARSITTRLGWRSERVSLALMALWAAGRAEVETSEPYGWRRTA